MMLFILLYLSVSVLTAHGVRLQVKNDSTDIIVKAEYDGGSVIVNAPVTIRFETGTMAAYIFLKGKTDQNGIFRFTPHRRGTWTITVDDGMGHMGEEVFVLNPKQKKSHEPASTNKSDKNKSDKKEEKPKTPFSKQDMSQYLLKIFLAVGLILLITFILNRLQKKQESKINK